MDLLMGSKDFCRTATFNRQASPTVGWHSLKIWGGQIWLAHLFVEIAAKGTPGSGVLEAMCATSLMLR